MAQLVTVALFWGTLPSALSSGALSSGALTDGGDATSTSICESFSGYLETAAQSEQWPPSETHDILREQQRQGPKVSGLTRYWRHAPVPLHSILQ